MADLRHVIAGYLSLFCVDAARSWGSRNVRLQRRKAGAIATTMSLIGQSISQYRVLREIGHGGMATVYEAEDTLLARHVALKVINESLLRDESAIVRFEREARSAAALDHPNICTVYELTEYEGRPVIVMELVEGERPSRGCAARTNSHCQRNRYRDCRRGCA